jgi:preprotein translocase subunit SecF
MMWATVALLVCSAVGAFSVAYISSYILDSFQNTNAMVMLITDAGTKSDDKNLERQLTSATLGLKACRDLGWALAVGCVGVGVAVFLRFRRQNAS